MKAKLMIVLGACWLAQYCTPRPQATAETCFQGRLVKRGICGQRVVELLGNNGQPLSVAGEWRDSLSGKVYQHVFTVENPCDFPSAIVQGETFEFRLGTSAGAGCMQCYAYTPVPAEKNSILIGCMK